MNLSQKISQSMKINKSQVMSMNSNLIGRKREQYYGGNLLSGIDEHSHESNEVSKLHSIMNQSIKTSSHDSSAGSNSRRKILDLHECSELNTPRTENLEDISA